MESSGKALISNDSEAYYHSYKGKPTVDEDSIILQELINNIETFTNNEENLPILKMVLVTVTKQPLQSITPETLKLLIQLAICLTESCVTSSITKNQSGRYPQQNGISSRLRILACSIFHKLTHIIMEDKLFSKLMEIHDLDHIKSQRILISLIVKVTLHDLEIQAHPQLAHELWNFLMFLPNVRNFFRTEDNFPDGWINMNEMSDDELLIIADLTHIYFKDYYRLDPMSKDPKYLFRRIKKAVLAEKLLSELWPEGFYNLIEGHLRDLLNDWKFLEAEGLSALQETISRFSEISGSHSARELKGIVLKNTILKFIVQGQSEKAISAFMDYLEGPDSKSSNIFFILSIGLELSPEIELFNREMLIASCKEFLTQQTENPKVAFKILGRCRQISSFLELFDVAMRGLKDKQTIENYLDTSLRLLHRRMQSDDFTQVILQNLNQEFENLLKILKRLSTISQRSKGEDKTHYDFKFALVLLTARLNEQEKYRESMELSKTLLECCFFSNRELGTLYYIIIDNLILLGEYDHKLMQYYMHMCENNASKANFMLTMTELKFIIRERASIKVSEEVHVDYDQEIKHNISVLISQLLVTPNFNLNCMLSYLQRSLVPTCQSQNPSQASNEFSLLLLILRILHDAIRKSKMFPFQKQASCLITLNNFLALQLSKYNSLLSLDQIDEKQKQLLVESIGNKSVIDRLRLIFSIYWDFLFEGFCLSLEYYPGIWESENTGRELLCPRSLQYVVKIYSNWVVQLEKLQFETVLLQEILVYQIKLMTVRLFIQFSSNEQAGNVVNLKNCELGKAMGFLMTNFENVDQTEMMKYYQLVIQLAQLTVELVEAGKCPPSVLNETFAMLHRLKDKRLTEDVWLRYVVIGFKVIANFRPSLLDSFVKLVYAHAYFKPSILLLFGGIAQIAKQPQVSTSVWRIYYKRILKDGLFGELPIEVYHEALDYITEKEELVDLFREMTKQLSSLSQEKEICPKIETSLLLLSKRIAPICEDSYEEEDQSLSKRLKHAADDLFAQSQKLLMKSNIK